MTYAIGIAVCDDTVALCIERDGARYLMRWRHSSTHAHGAALEAVERARALHPAHDEPRTIYLRQRSVVDQLRAPDVVWSSARAPDGEHPAVDVAFRHAAGEIEAESRRPDYAASRAHWDRVFADLRPDSPPWRDRPKS